MLFYIIIICALIFVIWVVYELYRAPLMEDEKTSLYDKDDPTTTCWDNDYNHTEGDFH